MSVPGRLWRKRASNSGTSITAETLISVGGWLSHASKSVNTTSRRKNTARRTFSPAGPFLSPNLFPQSSTDQLQLTLELLLERLLRRLGRSGGRSGDCGRCDDGVGDFDAFVGGCEFGLEAQDSEAEEFDDLWWIGNGIRVGSDGIASTESDPSL